MSKIEIPTMLFWENGNTWCGSCGNTRFFIHPVTHDPEEGAPEGTPGQVCLDVDIWKGPLCKELSEVILTGSFPRTEEGLEALIAWLESESDRINQE